MRVATYGDDAERFSRRSPTLNSNGTIAFVKEDAQVSEGLPVRTIVHRVVTLENDGDLANMARAFGRSKTELMLHKATLYVTDARVAFVWNKQDSPREKIVGHVRYPWLQSVEFRPRQSFLKDSIIRLSFIEDFPVAALGTWFHEVEFTFDKAFHPALLALDIAKRASAHNFANGAPAAAEQAVKKIQTAEVLPDPPKGETAMYIIPAFKAFPGGADYIGDDIPDIDWVVASGV